MSILLVEDDTTLRPALEELLLWEGYEVIKAPNARAVGCAGAWWKKVKRRK